MSCISSLCRAACRVPIPGAEHPSGIFNSQRQKDAVHGLGQAHAAPLPKQGCLYQATCFRAHWAFTDKGKTPWVRTLTPKGLCALAIRQSILKLGCEGCIYVRRQFFTANGWCSSTLEWQLFRYHMLISVRVFADGYDICIQSILLVLLLPKVMDQLEKLKCSKSLGLG